MMGIYWPSAYLTCKDFTEKYCVGKNTAQVQNDTCDGEKTMMEGTSESDGDAEAQCITWRLIVAAAIHFDVREVDLPKYYKSVFRICESSRWPTANF